MTRIAGGAALIGAATMALTIGPAGSAAAQPGQVATPAPLRAPAMTYDCDAPAGHSSSIELAAPGQAFLVQGTVRAYRAYPSKVPPAATIALRDAAPGGDSMALRLTTADTAGASYATVMEVTQQGRRSISQGPRVAVNQPIAFAVAMPQPGRLEMVVGQQQFVTTIRPAARMTITIGCTTGGFKFERLGWGVL